MRSTDRLFLMIAPVPAVLIGAWAAERHGVSLNVYAPNLVAVFLGILFSAAVLKLPRKNLNRSLVWISGLSFVGLPRFVGLSANRSNVAGIYSPPPVLKVYSDRL